MDNLELSAFCGPRLLTEDYIPGRSYLGRLLSTLKNWRSVNKSQTRETVNKIHSFIIRVMLSNKFNPKYLLRVEEYVKRNLDQHIVDPDDNLVYTKRTLHQMSGGFEVALLDSGDSSGTVCHAPDVPKTGWGTSLDKYPMFTRAEMDLARCQVREKYWWRVTPRASFTTHWPEEGENLSQGWEPRCVFKNLTFQLHMQDHNWHTWLPQKQYRGLQSVAKLVTHSAKFWNFLDERRTTAKKNNVCQISPRPPNQCWSLFPALWSFRVWSTLCRGEGGKFYLGLGCSKIRQKRSSVSLLLKPIVRKCHLQKYA